MKPQEILKLLKNSAQLSETTLPQTEQLVRDYPWFAAAHALYAKNLKISGRSGYEEALRKAALLSPDRRWLKNLITGAGLSDKHTRTAEEYTLPESPAEEPLNASESRLDKSRLIEDFLEKGARFNTFSEDESGKQTVDLSEKAVSLNDEIVTESFANILVSQKKFVEALDVFQKLSLRFPEKSIYFAARIEEIKKVLNINN